MTDDLILVGEAERSLAIVAADAGPHITNVREAFEWALPASRALPKEKLARLNVDIKDAPSIVKGAFEHILPFRARLAALPEFDVRSFDTLRWHAIATAQAEGIFMGVSAESTRVPELVKRTRAWRRLLLQDLTIMTTRNVLPAEKYAHLKPKSRYLDQSYDLAALVSVYRTAWPTLSGHSTVSTQELDDAESTAEQLRNALATDADRSKAIRDANEQRIRNFTLLAEAYDQVRRGLHYLRWNEGDADKIAPSLYRGRGGSRRKAKAEGEGAKASGDETNALVPSLAAAPRPARPDSRLASDE